MDSSKGHVRVAHSAKCPFSRPLPSHVSFTAAIFAEYSSIFNVKSFLWALVSDERVCTLSLPPLKNIWKRSIVGR